MTSIFKDQLPKTRPFPSNQNKGPHLGSRYIHIYIERERYCWHKSCKSKPVFFRGGSGFVTNWLVMNQCKKSHFGCFNFGCWFKAMSLRNTLGNKTHLHRYQADTTVTLLLAYQRHAAWVSITLKKQLHRYQGLKERVLHTFTFQGIRHIPPGKRKIIDSKGPFL